MLTNLFDQSYIHPKQGDGAVDMNDPYLSPAAATDWFLKEAYPDDIVMYTCEYDMLCAEGVEFGERLASPSIGKRLHGGMIKGVPHAFDKKPNPLSFPVAADRCYAEACAELKRCFGGRTSVDERRILEQSLVVERFEAEEHGDRVIGEGQGDGAEESEDDGIEMLSRDRRRQTIALYRERWKCNKAMDDVEREREKERVGGGQSAVSLSVEGEPVRPRYEERLYPPP